VPEGPEVARQADQIRAAIAPGARPRSATVWFGIAKLERWSKVLSGLKVRRVRARGKAFLIEFGPAREPLTLYAHLQLAGKWVVIGPGEAPPETTRSLRVRLEGSGGTALLYSASEVEVLDSTQLAEHSYLSSLGPDVLGELDLAGVRERLRDPRFARSSLAGLYLRQDFLAGLGNYLRSEILHHAKLHPDRRLQDLSAAELRRLAKSTLDLPRQSYETGGITNPPRRAKRLQAAGVPYRSTRWWVFEREGEPCYRCQSPIQRIQRGSRRVYLCDTCQLCL
jgi:endonuclease VIII